VGTEPGREGAHASPAGSAKPGRDHLWPWLLAIALALVMLVNGIFIWIAVSGADEVAPSYSQGDR
jgi:hypothetical protein